MESINQVSQSNIVIFYRNDETVDVIETNS